MSLPSYLEFVPGREVCIPASESTYIIPVRHHGTIVGQLKLNKLNVSLRGEVKHMLKHILLFARDSEGYLYNDSERYIKDPEITTSLDWEMKHKEVIIYFKDYAPTVAFIVMKDAPINPAQAIPTLSALCESSFIGLSSFPAYYSPIQGFVRGQQKVRTMDERSMDAVIGLMSMCRRSLNFQENQFVDEIKRKRKASSINPEFQPNFQVILVHNKRSYLFCELYPERDT